MACEREIRIRRDRSEHALSSLRRSLAAVRSESDQRVANREKLSKLKDQLRRMEADLSSALEVKTCKEAKRTAISESLSTTVSRAEQLEKTVQDQKLRKDEHGAVISQQLHSLLDIEEKSNQDAMEIKNIEEAIMWYKRVLGFQTEGGEGVKFIFHNIDSKNPDDEYSFTVRLDGDTYNLLNCDPYVEGISELIKELNKTNGLFKFVRVMREKFRAAALNGALPAASSMNPDTSSVTISSPPPVSVDSRSDWPMKENIPQLQPTKAQLNLHKMVNSGHVAMSSPQSLSLRRSPRFAAKKHT